MWEIRVEHTGLQAYRVVRGETKEEAAYKAQLQRMRWDERWEARKSVLQNKSRRLQRSLSIASKKQQALDQSIEAKQAVAAIETILLEGCRAPILQWEDLKTKTPFAEPHPEEPCAPAYPEAPDPIFYKTRLSVLDRLIRSRRVAKEHASASALASAQEEWETKCSILRRSHEHELELHEQAIADWNQMQRDHTAREGAEHDRLDEMRNGYIAARPESVEFFLSEVLARSEYPDAFPQGFTVSFNAQSGVFVVDFELPNKNAIPTLKEVKYVATRDVLQEVPTSEVWRRRIYDDLLYQVSLRTLHELFTADESNVLKSIVFNGWVRSIDVATGSEAHACVLSLQTGRDEFSRINLSQVDPRACFRKLKGVAASKLTELIPVRPILSLNREDPRFVEAYAVAETLDDRTNLAAMDWMDFENLIRELFEHEFARNGGEVKITQASRDGGVDAVIFDPDPLRGGKIIVQAKRYTNVVGVSAVRDLFGTVQHEGATKGILVTTATYGPDAYEFARDKPITLLSGAELLKLLEDQGHHAKIDLAGAKLLSRP